MSPRAFSFNSPHGACQECQGLGATWDFDPGAHRPRPDQVAGRRRYRALGARRSETGARRAAVAVRRRSGSLSTRRLRSFRRSTGTCCCSVRRGRRGVATEILGRAREEKGRRRSGAMPIRSARTSRAWSPISAAVSPRPPGRRRRNMDQYRALRTCPACQGERLKPESRAMRVKGRRIAEYVNLPITEAQRVFGSLELTDRESIIAGRILKEIQDRLRFLNDVGVGYLTVARSAATLSGGEGQRIRLATQIGSEPDRRPLRARRAVDWPAPARQPGAAHHARAPSRSRQHGHRRRA